jgi:hypothetical protein
MRVNRETSGFVRENFREEKHWRQRVERGFTDKDTAYREIRGDLIELVLVRDYIYGERVHIKRYWGALIE